MKRFLISIVLIHLLFYAAVQGEERLLTDELGWKVKIPSHPRRIISLAPSITEILFILDLDEEIAGVTDFCDYPVGVSKKRRIGGFINPSIERILLLEPDLVIATRDGNRWETIQRLRDLGLSVYVIDPKSFDGVMKTTQNIGEVVERRNESRRVVETMRKRKEEILALTRSLSRPKVFFQVGYAPIITVGRGTLVDDLIRLAGGRSISEDESLNYPVYSIEVIMLKAPEIIIMSSMESKRDYLNLIKMWQSWKSIPAVKMNAIYVVDSNLVDRPSPRIVEGLEAMAKMIHPKALGGR
jgi:iron complex transport system substrate-binding protein